jgi:hypothetical protein
MYLFRHLSYSLKNCSHELAQPKGQQQQQHNSSILHELILQQDGYNAVSAGWSTPASAVRVLRLRLVHAYMHAFRLLLQKLQ